MQVAHTCESHGAAGCEVYPFDLLKTDLIDSVAKKILGDRQVDVLVNNAGIMVAGSAHQGMLKAGMHVSTSLCQSILALHLDVLAVLQEMHVVATSSSTACTATDKDLLFQILTLTD